jgi:hypothetical protein
MRSNITYGLAARFVSGQLYRHVPSRTSLSFSWRGPLRRIQVSALPIIAQALRVIVEELIDGQSNTRKRGPTD